MTAEQVEYVTNIDQYIQFNNLRQLFYNLTSQITKAQPDDPIQFLIDHLENKIHLRLIYINGIVKNDTINLANSLSLKFNYNLIDMFTEMNTEDINSIDNDKINRKVVEQIQKIGKNVKGAIICGYPNNHIQGEFLQKKGYFPERLFIYPTDQLIMEKYYINQGITPNKAKLLNVRNSMNVNQVRTLFEKVIDILPQSIDTAKTIANNIIKIKDISPYPLDSPRILIVHPPYIQLPAIKHLCNEFGLYFISVQSAFLKFKSQKNTFRQYIRNFKSFTPQLQLGIVRTQCTSVVAKKKGFVLSGWPNSSNKLTFLDQYYLRPHIIFALCGERQQIQILFNKTDTNNSQLFPLKPKPTIQQYRQELDKYNKFLIEIKKIPKTQILTLHINEKDFVRAFENKISNRNIYK